MSHPFHSFGRDHDARLDRLSKLGLGLIIVGVPCMLIGFGLFASVLFSSGKGSAGVEFTPGQLVFGMVTITVGCFCAMVGLPTLFAAHSDKIFGSFLTRPVAPAHRPNQLDARACKTCGRTHH